MQNVDTRVVAHAVRAGGGMRRELAAARRALRTRQSDADAALEGTAGALLRRLVRNHATVRTKPGLLAGARAAATR